MNKETYEYATHRDHRYEIVVSLWRTHRYSLFLDLFKYIVRVKMSLLDDRVPRRGGRQPRGLRPES